MRYLIIGSLLFAFTTCDRSARDGEGRYGAQLGTVAIPLSCSDEANRQVERGTALLHHMTYEGARSEFASARAADPECAIAYWGEAMTYIHPLWSDPPGEEEFNAGLEVLKKSRELETIGDREAAFIGAAEAYYAAGRNRTEQPNLAAFAEAWEKVYAAYPGDPEAASFHALSLLATADPSDKSYAVQKRAGALAAEVLEQIADHPGGHHYVIHSYDYPPLAENALETARSYGEIAPAVPHALHMPSHIFTRLGYWEESIEMNLRSADAALDHPAGDQISLHYLHALDYLSYAYLQRGDDENAAAVLDRLESLEGPFQAHVGSSYTFAAVPARLALERHHWEQAAGLEPRKPSNYPWDQFPAMEAITHFARAVGAARSGDSETARSALERLSRLEEMAADGSAYWAEQVGIQHRTAEAWLTFAEGREEDALILMKEAADRESATEKHPVTPGEVLPARELLADMLFEMGRFESALEEYTNALQRNPNRYNSLYGGARAAELGGNGEAADHYYDRLVEVTAGSGSKRDGLEHARAYLAGTRTSR